MVEGRLLDDDGNVLLKLENGATGVLMAKGCRRRRKWHTAFVYGEKGGCEWYPARTNILVKWLDAPAQMPSRRKLSRPVIKFATHNCRTRVAIPKGYLEAFANIYRNFALTLSAQIDGTSTTPEMLDFPGVEDGIRGMAFIDNEVASAQSTEKWTAHIVE